VNLEQLSAPLAILNFIITPICLALEMKCSDVKIICLSICSILNMNISAEEDFTFKAPRKLIAQQNYMSDIY